MDDFKFYSREGLHQVSEAVRRLNSIDTETISHGSAQGPKVGGGVPGDPVSRVVLEREALAAERDELEAFIDGWREVIDGLRAMLGRSEPHRHFADVLDRHYFDLIPWEQVADEMGVTERTVRRWASDACDLIDDFGVARLREQVGYS